MWEGEQANQLVEGGHSGIDTEALEQVLDAVCEDCSVEQDGVKTRVDLGEFGSIDIDDDGNQIRAEFDDMNLTIKQNDDGSMAIEIKNPCDCFFCFWC